MMTKAEKLKVLELAIANLEESYLPTGKHIGICNCIFRAIHVMGYNKDGDVWKETMFRVREYFPDFLLGFNPVDSDSRFYWINPIYDEKECVVHSHIS